MRPFRFVSTGALVLALALPAAGQDDLLSTCNGLQPGDIEVQNANPAAGPLVDEARNQAIDQVRFLCSQVGMTLSNVQPTVGIAFSGGNPVLGTAGTIGTRFGFVPRFSITARANAALADLPDIFDDYAARIDPSQQELPPVETARIPLGSIQGDLAIGVFNGFPLGPALGGLGAIDLLGSIAFIPVIEEAGIEEAIINWGAGARIGILDGGLATPAVSVSGMYRKMDEVTFGDLDEGDPGRFSTDLSVLSLRAAVSKGIAVVDFTVGAGYDRYTSDPAFNFALECETTECQAAALDPTRPLVMTMAQDITGELETAAWNVFGNVGFDLSLLNVVAEVGYQQATDVIESDDIEGGRPLTEDEIGGGNLFGSLGLRVTI